MNTEKLWIPILSAIFFIASLVATPRVFQIFSMGLATIILAILLFRVVLEIGDDKKTKEEKKQKLGKYGVMFIVIIIGVLFVNIITSMVLASAPELENASIIKVIMQPLKFEK